MFKNKLGRACIFVIMLALPLAFWLGRNHLPLALFDSSEIGAKIYNQGIDSNGQPLIGLAEGDLEFKDAKFNCAQCHRRSGYGSAEGGNYVLPITGNILFNERDFNRNDLFHKLFVERQSEIFWASIRSSYQRPAYTEESLAALIREGIDPSGRELSPLMPRYKLSDSDMKALISYLKKLSAHNDPGVDEKTLYFATVVTKGVNADQKKAMLSTITKFIERLNLETKGNLARPNFSPGHRSEFSGSFRYWQHDVWELSDNPANWPKELAVYYAKKPVFALISGMATGDWTPIHRFCEENKIPSLFPIIELPPVHQQDHYSVYFNGGLSLEAKAMAKFLRKEKLQEAEGSLVEFHLANNPQSDIPANILADELKEKSIKLDRVSFKDVENFKLVWADYLKTHPNSATVIIWPGNAGAAIMAELSALATNVNRLILPSGALQAGMDKIPASLLPKLNFTYLSELPGAYNPNAFRVRAWLDSVQMPTGDETVQFKTYYGLYLLQTSLDNLVDHYSREYLLENIEREAENAINPGIYPSLSLGPDQRLASKGAYIVQWDPTTEGNLKQVGDWIVP